MNKVWAFGDSMTAPLGNVGPYYDWLGREGRTYCDFVAERFGMQSVNKGKSGSSPNQIFDDFLLNHKQINAGDILIIGWSPIMRYRMLAEDKNSKVVLWRQIVANGWNGGAQNECIDGTHITKEVAEHIILNRHTFCNSYSEEVNRWVSFIKEWGNLKDVKVIIWNWCSDNFGGAHSIVTDIPIRTRTDMSIESNGIVQDGHYGETGHKELADEIIDYINKLL